MSSVVEDPTGIWSGGLSRITFANLTIIAIAAFNGLAVVAALPSIAEDLGNVALLPWVATSNLGASAIAVIIAGPVIDAVGVRRTFRVGGLWVLATSAAAAAAPNMGLLLAARVLQGLGGGIVIAVAIASVGLAYPHSLRPRAFAANNVVWGMMGFGGPALAAGMLAIHGWRFIFIVEIPITVLALIAGWNALPSTREHPSRVTIDFLGVTYLTIATFLIILSLTEIGVHGLVSAASGAVAIATLSAYWRHAGRDSNPVLLRSHLTRFPLRWVHLSVALVLAAGLAADNYLPLYVQVTHGRSESFAAFSVIYLTVGWAVSSYVYAHRLSHRPEADAILLGAVMLVPSLASAGFAIAFAAPLPVIFAAFFAIGTSIGMVVTAGLTLIQGSSDPSEMGRVNSAHQYINTMALSCGVAFGGAILLFVVDRRVGDVESVRGVLSGEETALAPVVREAVEQGMVWAIAAGAALSLGCVATAFHLRKRTRSAVATLASPTTAGSGHEAGR